MMMSFLSKKNRLLCCLVVIYYLILPGFAQVEITIGPNETWHSLAESFGLTEAELKAANTQRRFAVGEKIVVPDPSVPEPQALDFLDFEEDKPVVSSEKETLPQTKSFSPSTHEVLSRLAVKAPRPKSESVSDLKPPSKSILGVKEAEKKEAMTSKVAVVQRGKRPQLASRSSSSARSAILNTARQYLGVPYRMGGTSRSSIDCSGLTMVVYAAHGLKLPRTADAQYAVCTPVPRGQEQVGDLVFFETYLPGPSHVGIYAGNGKFLHASSSKGVTISSLSNVYFAPRYLGTRRLVVKP